MEEMVEGLRAENEACRMEYQSIHFIDTVSESLESRNLLFEEYHDDIT